MITQEIREIVSKIRKREIDINNQSLFFPILIQGLILKLNKDISIRNMGVPHFILHTGDDTMYLMHKGQDASKEPLEISNEDYIYNQIPRCIVNPGSIDLVPDQLTNPYANGNIEFEYEDSEGNSHIYPLVAEFRRMPVKFNCSIKYYVDSYRDLMELTQQIVTKLAFIQTYYITYMGQTILCSYKIPEGFDGEHMTELDGTTTDGKARVLELQLEVESNFPVYSERTVMYAGNYINLHPQKDDKIEHGITRTPGRISLRGEQEPETDYKKYVMTADGEVTDDEGHPQYTNPPVNIHWSKNK